MNTLVINPSIRRVDWHLYENDEQKPSAVHRTAVADIIMEPLGSQPHCPKDTLPPDWPVPDIIGIRVPYGGEVFTNPVLVSPTVCRDLNQLALRAPMHIPAVLALTEFCKSTYPAVPAILVFDTAFFTTLPAREVFYALDIELQKSLGIRRTGYHGLFHEAAERFVAQKRRNHKPESCRTVSVCLEPRPEVAAVVDGRPLMVTSGATPLEGIPGETTCGAIDPAIPAVLAEKLGWGPEKINFVLTEASGILGLTGKSMTLAELFATTCKKCRLARKLITYRLLQACGMATAAMGGADALVFSGRYHSLAAVLGPMLASGIRLAHTSVAGEPDWFEFPGTLERLVADAAIMAARSCRRS